MESIFINKEDLLRMLGEYYSIKERRDLIIKYDIKIKYINGSYLIDVLFYTDIYIKGQKITIFLNNNDIYEVLSNYTKNKGYILDSYKYIGGIENNNKYINDTLPYFNGIELYVKNKTLVRK